MRKRYDWNDGWLFSEQFEDAMTEPVTVRFTVK
jgi:hypothetical protein